MDAYKSRALAKRQILRHIGFIWKLLTVSANSSKATDSFYHGSCYTKYSTYWRVVQCAL